MSTLKSGKIVCGNTKIWARPASGIKELVKSTDLSAYALSSHTHDASQIASGTLAVARGGTGVTTLAALKTAMGVTSTPTMLNSGVLNVHTDSSSNHYTGYISGRYGAATSDTSGTRIFAGSSPSMSSISIITGGCTYIIITTNVATYTLHAGGSVNVEYKYLFDDGMNTQTITVTTSIWLDSTGTTLSSNYYSGCFAYGSLIWRYALQSSFVAYRQS